MAYSLCMHCLDVIQCHIHMKASKGKCSALGLLDKVDHQLKIWSDEIAEENEWMQAGMHFLSYLYFGQSAQSLSDLRHTLFTKKRGPPKIKVFHRPQNMQSSISNVRAYQGLVWHAGDKTAPPEFTANQSLSSFSWKMEGVCVV